jgi:hypothetical protein
MTNEEILDLANNLTNENLRYLLDIMSDRLMVHCGVIENRCVGDDVGWCTLNGSKVQLNLQHCETDLRENKSWAWALYGERNETD